MMTSHQRSILKSKKPVKVLISHLSNNVVNVVTNPDDIKAFSVCVSFFSHLVYTLLHIGGPISGWFALASNHMHPSMGSNIYYDT
jgi:hypothetical protein